MIHTVKDANPSLGDGPIALAFSGGLDTSWCIGHLKETYDCEVITVTVDVGGLDSEEAESLEAKSHSLGAKAHVCIDAKVAFFDEILRYLIFGNVLRGNAYPICVGAERSLQAREVAKVARRLQIATIAHGCTAAGNDQVRFEVGLRTVAPELRILAPIRDLAPSRQRETDDLIARGFDVPTSVSQYSVNSGLWGLTIGGRETGTSSEDLPESAWIKTRDALSAKRADEDHVLTFRQGIPTAWDGKSMDPVALIEELDRQASLFGIGRGIHLGDTILGIKGRVAFEAPAASVLIQSHRELEKLTLSAEQLKFKETASKLYGDHLHEGRFLDPVCRDLEAFLTSSQQRVSGDVFLTFRTGQCWIKGCDSPHSLMSVSNAMYGESLGDWNPQDAAGFSKLYSLPSALHARAETPLKP